MSSTVAPLVEARAEGRYFYVYMGLAFLVIAFGGFIPTYWAPLVSDRFKGEPMLHIHGTLLFSWTLFYFVQTLLVARRQITNHRAWGLFGIALFSVLICSIFVTQEVVLHRWQATPSADAARRFASITLCALPPMIGLFAAAIYYIKRPEIHKRLMTVLMIFTMTPAIARVFVTVISSLGGGQVGITAGPPPPFVIVPTSAVGDLLLLVAVIYDFRTRGRVHRAYLVGAGIVVLYPIVAVLVARTDAWLGFVRAYEGLVG